VIAAALLLLAATQAAAAPPPREGQAASQADPSEAERRREAAEGDLVHWDLVNWGHTLPGPDLRSKEPIGEIHRLRIVNRTARSVTIEAAEYPGRDLTEILARTLRPGGRATLSLTAPVGACRVRLVTRPRMALRPFDLCRRGSLTLRR
jgi:hypothetical protein